MTELQTLDYRLAVEEMIGRINGFCALAFTHEQLFADGIKSEINRFDQKKKEILK
jgi:hypothetical protein